MERLQIVPGWFDSIYPLSHDNNRCRETERNGQEMSPAHAVFQPRNPYYLEEAELRVTDLFRGTGFEMYGIVTWVNTMGDSRTVKLLTATVGGVVNPTQPKIQEVTGDVARILGLKINHGGVVVTGGGIDPVEQIKHQLLHKLGLSISVVKMSDGV